MSPYCAQVFVLLLCHDTCPIRRKKMLLDVVSALDRVASRDTTIPLYKVYRFVAFSTFHTMRPSTYSLLKALALERSLGSCPSQHLSFELYDGGVQLVGGFLGIVGVCTTRVMVAVSSMSYLSMAMVLG